MKLGIMQPYFFPYIGYWQLMNAVDTYVIYDDVTFIKNGWINRNRILINREAHYFNLPIRGASSFTLIKDVALSGDKKEMQKLSKTIGMAYKKAPYFDDIMPLLENIISFQTEKMADFLEHHIRVISDFLDMDTKILLSSRDVDKDVDLRAHFKVLDICKKLGADEYYNAVGGQELYDRDFFAENGVKLFFLKTGDVRYRQYRNDFVPDLSIVDVLMFCGKNETKRLLADYTLL